ncbi:hypothetical protein [Streptomyces mirabilis]|uniref:hypothetical protein n=1 Tax=Streptomyces mirabilis TaxID=68239 RepID=UPI0036DD6D70
MSSGHLPRENSGRSACGAGAAGIGATAVGAGAVPALAAPAKASIAFVHPGLLHTQADFDRMAAKVKTGTGPWKQGYAKLAGNPRSASTWKASPLATLIRGATGDNVTTLAFDIAAAYQKWAPSRTPSRSSTPGASGRWWRLDATRGTPC